MATTMLGPIGAQLGNDDVSFRITVGTPGWVQEAHWVGDFDASRIRPVPVLAWNLAPISGPRQPLYRACRWRALRYGSVNTKAAVSLTTRAMPNTGNTSISTVMPATAGHCRCLRQPGRGQACLRWQPDKRSCHAGADDLPTASYSTPRIRAVNSNHLRNRCQKRRRIRLPEAGIASLCGEECLVTT
jgi:hypothetical protein